MVRSHYEIPTLYGNPRHHSIQFYTNQHFQNVLHFASRVPLFRRVVQQPRRNFGGHSQSEAIADYEKWRKYTWTVAVPAMGILTVYNLVVHFSHEHHQEEEEKEAPSYMKIRNRPFAWECSDCGLFEPACWAKCRQKKAM